jgi:hypothetical protein
MVELNYGDYKFTDFVEKVQNSIPTAMYKEPWMIEMLKISDVAKSKNVEEKITFSDDRLVLVAFKVMLKVNLRNIDIVEWAILYRYIEQYYIENKELKEEIKTYLNLYIGSTFSDYELTEEKASEMTMLKSKIIESGVEMPSFFSGVVSKVEEPKVEQVESSVLDEWMNLKEVCEMSLADKSTSKKDKMMYEKLLKTVALFV